MWGWGPCSRAQQCHGWSLSAALALFGFQIVSLWDLLSSTPGFRPLSVIDHTCLIHWAGILEPLFRFLADSFFLLLISFIPAVTGGYRPFRGWPVFFFLSLDFLTPPFLSFPHLAFPFFLIRLLQTLMSSCADLGLNQRGPRSRSGTFSTSHALIGRWCECHSDGSKTVKHSALEEGNHLPIGSQPNNNSKEIIWNMKCFVLSLLTNCPSLF